MWWGKCYEYMYRSFILFYFAKTHHFQSPNDGFFSRIIWYSWLCNVEIWISQCGICPHVFHWHVCAIMMSPKWLMHPVGFYHHTVLIDTARWSHCDIQRYFLRTIPWISEVESHIFQNVWETLTFALISRWKTIADFGEFGMLVLHFENRQVWGLKCKELSSSPNSARFHRYIGQLELEISSYCGENIAI